MVVDILIVEDLATERERVQHLAQELGYSVDVASSVAEAITLIKRSHYRLLILDIGLTDRSGSHLLHVVREHAAGSGGIPPMVIILTGNPSTHLRERLIAEGVVDYISKGSPESDGKLLAVRLSQLLGQPTPREQLGIPLKEFVERCIPVGARGFFLDATGALPACTQCGEQSFSVSFDTPPQMPPKVEGTIRCVRCGGELDPLL